jgi:hypothetical protein
MSEIIRYSFPESVDPEEVAEDVALACSCRSAFTGGRRPGWKCRTT